MPGLAERIASFPQWAYPFEFPDGTRVSVPPEIENRTRQRQHYFFDPLVGLCGGSLNGRRVLDLACNAGWWSLSAMKAGAEYVHGVDGREMHIQQARLVFSEHGIDPSRWRFETGNVFDLDQISGYDIVLCLGLLYHVAKPFELIERISSWNTDLAVIETSVNRYPGSILEIHHEDTTDMANAIDYSLVVSPSKTAVTEIASTFGYRTAVLRPNFTSWQGCRDYRNGTRRAFISAKRTPLAGLDIERPRPMRDATAWIARVVGRTYIKRH
ncbi:MAG TPA: class I SAM-dependent methyltransferase [Solirubrobacteraceae bacterium]|nr:class I SAM-dependent methyltransferase [Solirubrobacteraceae bacterium]